MDTEHIVGQLRAEMERIGHAIGLLEGNAPAKRVGRPPNSVATGPAPRKGGLTPAGRRKLAEAMRRRWAERRGASPGSKAGVKATAATKPKKSGGMSEQGRKNIAAAMKKRWAQKKRMAKS